MRKAEITSYSVLDLLSWQESGGLLVSPKFQRRGVWATPAKGHLIDSILLGYPIPPIHIRLVDTADGRVTREVIDGQQRIRAVFDFIDGRFRIPKSVSQTWGGNTFAELNDDARETLRLFSFVVYQYKKLSDVDVLDMFSRLNTYSVSLNSQELRNGRWFGEFKRLSYTLAAESLEFWRQKRIVSESQIARMREAELVSELLILQMDGLQDKKKSIDVFYDQLDEEWGPAPIDWTTGRNEASRSQPHEYFAAAEAASRFRDTLAHLDAAVGDILADNPLRRPALFYTLFGAIYHLLHGVPRLPELPLAARGMTPEIRGAIKRASIQLAEVFDEDGRTRNSSQADFYSASAQQTDNLEPRLTRLRTFLEMIAESL